MSEIWTPGDDDKESKPSGGIELPKGFASRRQRTRREEEERQNEEEPQEAERSETPATPAEEGLGPVGDQIFEVETPVQPEVPAPEQSGRQSSQFRFPPSGAQIQCPSCGTAFVTPVFSIVDLGANPELRQALLGGQINMASCPNCGAGGALSAPLMVHDPENKFLGVLIPAQSQLNDVQTQQVIGEMTKALMNQLPTEERRGYLLQPQQFFDWDSFLEKLWGFEGVTPEELRQQREQAELVSRLVRLAGDEEAMRLVLERKQDLIDANFFALLGQVMQAYAAQGEDEKLDSLRQLRQHLMDTTEAGAEVKQFEGRVQEAAGKLRPDMSREEFLALITDYWQQGEEGETIASALLSMARPLADYQFLMLLAQRIEQAGAEEAEQLTELRDLVVEMNDQQGRSQQAMLQQVQAILQEVLQSSDTEATLREHADQIDELFLNVLAANIQQAEERKANAAVRRLRKVYEQAVSIVEEQMPEDVRLLNRLLSASDKATVRQLLQENRNLLDQEFVAALSALDERFRNEGNTEMADRIKSLRGQIALML